MDKRHARRQKIVQQLFAASFGGRDESGSQHEKTLDVVHHTEQIDAHIVKYAQKYDIDKIAKIDLAILRLAVYELLIENDVPPKVVINEAVELAKELGGEKSPGFVNAVLGKIYEELPESTDAATA